jgi:hypothetical protein
METSGDYTYELAANPCLTSEQRAQPFIADALPDCTGCTRGVLDREGSEWT